MHNMRMRREPTTFQEYFTFGENIERIEQEIKNYTRADIALRSETVDVDEQFARSFWRLQNERFQRYMPVFMETLQERVNQARKEPNNERFKKLVQEKLHQYSMNFLDFTVEGMAEMFDWDEEQTKKALALLYTHAVKPHEDFLMAQLGKSEEKIAQDATPEQHWLALQLDAVYNAGMSAREQQIPLRDALGPLPPKGAEKTSGKNVFLNQAGWYATEATYAFAENLLPGVGDFLPDLLLDLFSLSDEELQELVIDPITPADKVKAQIVMFAVQAANLTWIQVQPFRAAVFGDFNRIDPKKAKYFMPFLFMSNEKGWPAVLLDRDQILQGVRIKQREMQGQ